MIHFLQALNAFKSTLSTLPMYYYPYCNMVPAPDLYWHLGVTGRVKGGKTRAPNARVENWLKCAVLIRNTLLNDSLQNTILKFIIIRDR